MAALEKELTELDKDTLVYRFYEEIAQRLDAGETLSSRMKRQLDKLVAKSSDKDLGLSDGRQNARLDQFF